LHNLKSVKLNLSKVKFKSQERILFAIKEGWQFKKMVQLIDSFYGREIF